MEILPLFCEIGDFCKVFEQIYQQSLDRRQMSEATNSFKPIGRDDNARAVSPIRLQEIESLLFTRSLATAQFGFLCSV